MVQLIHGVDLSGFYYKWLMMYDLVFPGKGAVVGSNSAANGQSKLPDKLIAILFDPIKASS